jgi:large subunit ribosomal protein L15
MGLHELSPAEGSRKARKRKGRGHSAGQGKTAGKGHKGRKARAGGATEPGFEGGQMPLYRRLPKRGFNNGLFRKSYVIVNLSDLQSFAEGATVDLEVLLEAKIVKSARVTNGLKVLGNGDVGVALNVRATKISAAAAKKIEAAGGTAEVI